MRYDRPVMNSNKEHNNFPIQHFVHTYTRNSKTTERMLLTEMSTYCVRAGCKILMARYPSNHELLSLSDKPFLLDINLETSGHMWTFSISNDCFIVGDILCVV